jgi:hypothetical protein
MYPLDSSSYTSWDGKKYEVNCTIPGAAVGVDLSYECPDGFVSPREEGDPRNCIQVMSPQLALPLSCKWLLCVLNCIQVISPLSLSISYAYALHIIFSFFFRSRNFQLLPALSSECLHHGRVRYHAECRRDSLNDWFHPECVHGCDMVCIVFQLSTTTGKK